MNTSTQPLTVPTNIATPVTIESNDFSNKSIIADANGKRIIVCHAKISEELVYLINSQAKPVATDDNVDQFDIHSDIWDQVVI